MRFVVFDDYRVGQLRGSEVVDVSQLVPAWAPGDRRAMNRFIAAFPHLRARLEEVHLGFPTQPLDQVMLRPPVPDPPHLLLKGTNYAEHVTEMQHQGLLGTRDSTEDVGFFIKATASIAAPGDPIKLPLRHFPGRRFDHEGEIAFVVGKEARAVAPKQALEHIFGFTLLLDITLRNQPGGQVNPVQRKSFESFTPMGPCVVTIDEVRDPADMKLRVWVNGELRQDGTTRDMLVDMPTLLSRASCIFPLQPGDVYTTGTPPGVGPLEPGDTVVLECDDIGRLSAPVIEREW